MDDGGKPAAHEGRPGHGPAFFDALLALAADRSRERIFIADIVQVMGDRALAVLILLFALPNALPMPPGTSAVLGLPLLFLTAQLALGRESWLPRAIVSRSLARNDFLALLNRAARGCGVHSGGSGRGWTCC